MLADSTTCLVGGLNVEIDLHTLLGHHQYCIHPTENRNLAIPQVFANSSFDPQSRKIRWLSQNQRKIYHFYDNFQSCISVVSALQIFNFNGKY